MHILQVPGHIPFPAPARVAGVRHQLVPEGHLPFEIFRLELGERTAVEKEGVTVGCLEIQLGGLLARWFCELLLEPLHESKGMGEPEAAAVQDIVAVKNRNRRRLGRHGLQGGMRVNHPSGGEEAEVGNAL